MTELLDLAAIRARSLAYRDASGPLDGVAARTAADSATDVPALLAEVERLTAELAKAQWHQERCHAHHVASDADVSRVRVLADEHVEHADGCGLLAGQILETLDAPVQDAASGRTDLAEGDATHEAPPDAPRAAEGFRLVELNVELHGAPHTSIERVERWRTPCCEEFDRTGITHTEACWALDGEAEAASDG